jgi:hypothetical protein
MDIHFISSLTPDDEDRLAPALIAALRPMLEMMPIAYTIRIRTGNNALYQHTRAELATVEPAVSEGDPPRGPLRLTL